MPENKLHRVCPPHGPCALCHHEEGAEEERAAVVAWLRSMVTGTKPGVYDAIEAGYLADAIERGEHVAKGDGEG